MIDFLKLTSLEDVTEMLWADGPAALLIAGGTDILVHPEPFSEKKILIDISQVDELRKIEFEKKGLIKIGAAVTHQEIADDPLIRRRAHLLGLACAAVGSTQIRNLGTIGGNLGNASPAGDSIPALACLKAEIILTGRDRQRFVPILEFFKGPGETVLGFDEIIEAVKIPIRKGRTVAFFKKAGQRKGMCCSKASVALIARRHSDDRLSKVCIAMGAVGPEVIDVPEAARALEGQVLGAQVIRAAADCCCRAVRAIDDIRSTAKYRRHVVGALLTEGLLEIFDHMSKLKKRRKRRLRRLR
ncbi:MAG: xanthine dehydrogenase family protein subunit M [Deltaproteobacteria bacterium]|nr:xanthine dehydrogenase family protein subunit M [Deltaproteobacteria bacterium]